MRYVVQMVCLFCICLFLSCNIKSDAMMQLSGIVEKQETDVKQDSQIKRVALTFDDGPHPTNTPKLLDGLKKRNVKATFFLIGENIAGCESIVARMSNEGHLIGNHTFHHVPLNCLNEELACQEITKANDVIEQITKKPTEFIRPPFGAWSSKRSCPVELFPILWSIDPLDWKIQNTESVVQRVLSQVKDGSVILLHDIYETSVDAAFQIMDRLQAEGYEFVTADQLILD